MVNKDEYILYKLLFLCYPVCITKYTA